MSNDNIKAEDKRLEDNTAHSVFWKKWGPYLSERQWGTVREDYSEDGEAWDYFPHDHARSRAYRWGEDGLAGISDIYQNLCFALALWNGRDPILKERLYGLNNREGNHAEDVKELYYYLDNTPTHSYMKYLYKYPQAEFPYRELLERNRKRKRLDPEYELLNAGIFNENKYFDVYVEYAKADVEDIPIKIFYKKFEPDEPFSDVVQVQRQAFAGLLWSKQYYNYEIETWLNGDEGQPPPPEARRHGRNHDWKYLFNRDVISMPDKWEYPWYASWDLAFHCIPISVIDPDYAKELLILFLREWYMRPNGQIPAYEWNFSDLVLFYEYFHGDSCRGLGASHQTGWTGLVAEMIQWCWCK